MNDETNTETTPQEELSIGDLLRTEREKKGISKSRLAEVIKVREYVIDALEKEEWDILPARVFIKGFIRSYTISIGYDTKKALRLFDKSLPSNGEDSPVPLAATRKKNRILYYAVPLLIILSLVVYLFAGKDKVENVTESLQAVSETSSYPAETFQEPGNSGQLDSVETAAKETTTSEPQNKVLAREEQPKPSVEKPEEIQKENTPAADPRKPVQEEESSLTEESGEALYEEGITESESTSDEPPASMMTLSAMVIDRTYVKIIVDDNPPKEYIFQQGANPNWKAERGFEITVGNAAGIEFEFNGEAFDNLGREGRVKTLRFPKDFKTNWEEE